MSSFVTYVTADRVLEIDHLSLEEAVVGFGKGVFDEISVAESKTGKGQPLVVSIGGIALTVVPMAFPLPGDAYTEALRRNLVWAEALPTLLAAKVHIIVAALNNPTTHAESFRTAKAMTILVAAVTKCISGSAIVWTEGQTVSPPKDFMDAAAHLSRGKTPVTQWTSMLFEQHSNGTAGKKNSDCYD